MKSEKTRDKRETAQVYVENTRRLSTELRAQYNTKRAARHGNVTLLNAWISARVYTLFLVCYCLTLLPLAHQAKRDRESNGGYWLVGSLMKI